MYSYQRSSALFVAAKRHIPGGVNSPVRAFGSVGGTPVFIQKAKGAYLYDVDGNAYIDYISSWGPMILGHNPPHIITAIAEQLQLGISFGTVTQAEVEIAQLITTQVPHIEQIRMVNSGTEACMSAIRLARGVTQRAKVIKFEGCYHGHSDAFLIKAGSGSATFGSPNSLGVTQGVAQDTLTATFNNLASVDRLLQAQGDQVAAIILEPIPGNMGCIPPQPDFLQGLRRRCDDYGILLIFDEVMTGFRMGFGGAQELFGVRADVVAYGKIIGAGLPVGAFAASREVMAQLSPMGGVYQAGTLSGNPLAMRAGLALLTTLCQDGAIYEQLEQKTEQLADGLRQALAGKVPFHIQTIGSMLTVFFTQEKVSDFEGAKRADNAHFKTFFHHMLRHGIYLPPSSFETWFISQAISPQDIQKTVEVASRCVF